MFHIILLYLVVVTAKDGHWSYNDLSTWPGTCTVGNYWQSPINFDPVTVKRTCRFAKLHFNEKRPLKNSLFTNNGHSIQTTVNRDEILSIFGGNLPDPGVYDLAQFHFHWSQKDYEGSEHTVAQLHYPLEAHFVFINRNVKFSKAASTRNGIAVFAVFFAIDENISKDAFEPLLPYLKKYAKFSKLKGNNTQQIEPIFPFSFFPKNHDTFYRYYGSLTTPHCDEVVVWTVFTQPMPIRPDTLKLFRQVTDKDDHVHNFNFRPTQPLNDRTVWLASSPEGPECKNGKIDQSYDSTSGSFEQTIPNMTIITVLSMIVILMTI